MATVYRHLEGFHLPFMKLLQEQGYEVHAYGRPDEGKNGLEELGIYCHDTFFQRNPFKLENLGALRYLISSFREEQFQLIHVHTPVASALGRMAAKFTGVPNVVYTAHGFHFFNGAPLRNWLIYFSVERLLAHWTDYLITINGEDFRRAQKFPVRKEVIYVPGVGLDITSAKVFDQITEQKRIRQELGIGERDFLILYVGELIPNKNHCQLFDAVDDIIEKNHRVHCILAGSGKSESRLKDYIKKRQLKANFHFLGFRRDIPRLMAAADVVTLLSKREGLPRVLMEAMAAGKPIVATNIRGNRDLVEHGVTGFLVPLFDITKTKDAFLTLLNDPDLREKMGLKAREQVIHYDIENITTQMAEIYHRILKINTPNHGNLPIEY